MTKFGDNSLFGLIHDYLKVYLPNHRRLSPNTIRSYKNCLSQFVDFVKVFKHVALTNVTFEMLTAETILAYLDSLETEHGCSISTHNNRLRALHAFFEFAAERDITTLVNLNELKKVPVKKTKEIEIVDYMTMEAVSAVVEQANLGTLKGLRNHFFMMLMYDTGARIQEMIDIKLGDFSFGKTSTVTLHGKGNKTRPVPLMENTVAHLKKYLAAYHSGETDSEQRLFYTIIHEKRHPISDDCVRKFLKLYGVSAREKCKEVPTNVHPHLFRHSRAMHLYQNGMDLTLVAQWLGHAQLDTTKIYAHADTEQKRKAIAKSTPRDSPLYAKLNSERFTISDDETLKRLSGLMWIEVDFNHDFLNLANILPLTSFEVSGFLITTFYSKKPITANSIINLVMSILPRFPD
jgi:site-specific recombinase XerD